MGGQSRDGMFSRFHPYSTDTLKISDPTNTIIVTGGKAKPLKVRITNRYPPPKGTPRDGNN
jgi:hypothetical protein